MIALIYRIVDDPRRAFTLILVLLPVLAACIQMTAAKATIVGLPVPAFWWGGTGAVEVGGLVLRRIWGRSERKPPSGAG